MNTIAFIGVGNMGGPMAVNLHKAGQKLKVFDVSQEAIVKAKNAGIPVASTKLECLKEAQFVISMLPSSSFVEDLYLGPHGILANAAKGTFFIDCSTISPNTARVVSAEAKKLGHMMIDAPVSGGTAGAQAGTLTFMVGGDQIDFDKAKPILEIMGKKIFYAGESGAGQVAKICNNMLLAIHMIGSCEALELGKQQGLDPKVLSEILLQSSGKNWSLEVYNPWPGIQENSLATKNYQGGFAVDLMTKDLSLAQEAALEKNVPTPLGALAKTLFRIHSLKGNGRLDFSSILKFLQDKQ